MDNRQPPPLPPLRPSKEKQLTREEYMRRKELFLKEREASHKQVRQCLVERLSIFTLTVSLEN